MLQTNSAHLSSTSSRLKGMRSEVVDTSAQEYENLSGFEKGMRSEVVDTSAQEYENLSGSESLFVTLVLGIGLCGFIAGCWGILRVFSAVI